MKLTEHVVKSFRLAKIFRENRERINSMDFSANGESLITSSDDESIIIYDCQSGVPKRTINSKKYGVDFVRYTHLPDSTIHTSTKLDDSIRYLSLHDNKYIRYYPGHTRKVVSLSMSPSDDSFLSGSLDHTVRLWDLRSPNCQGLMHLNGRPVASFDPEGLIFAVGVESEVVKLYDMRTFDKGPFSSFEVESRRASEWMNLKFSPDGRMIALSVDDATVKIIDAFTGSDMYTLHSIENAYRHLAMEVSFSPDSNFLFSGTTDGRVICWNMQTGSRVTILNSEHIGPVQSIQFNPKYMMLASACSCMIFWLPYMED